MDGWYLLIVKSIHLSVYYGSSETPKFVFLNVFFFYSLCIIYDMGGQLCGYWLKQESKPRARRSAISCIHGNINFFLFFLD